MAPTNGQVLTWNDALATPVEWQTPAAAGASATVESETAWGVSSDAGDSSEYSRGNHTHGTPPAPADINYCQHVTDATWELWVPLGCVTAYPITTTQALLKDVLYAYPFVISRSGATLDRLGWNQTGGGGAGKNGRCGIYRSTSVTNLYPGTLLVDGGAQSVNGTGVRSYTISQALPVGEVLWAAVLLEVGSTFKAAYTYSQATLLGDANTLPGTTYSAVSVAQAYGAMPASFPAAASLAIGAARFQVWGRFSA